MKTSKIAAAGLLAIFFTATAHAETPVFMSAEWASQACEAWNQDSVLTDKLKKSEWVDNHGGKGYKVMQIYREECPNSPRVEMHVADKDGKALCTYGGAAKTTDMSKKHDYLMWAEDKHWERMGSGKDGPMKAMMFGRLNFKGPKMEAMGNMGPFANFLLLTGKVPSDRSKCPEAPQAAPPAEPTTTPTTTPPAK